MKTALLSLLIALPALAFGQDPQTQRIVGRIDSLVAELEPLCRYERVEAGSYVANAPQPVFERFLDLARCLLAAAELGRGGPEIQSAVHGAMEKLGAYQLPFYCTLRPEFALHVASICHTRDGTGDPAGHVPRLRIYVLVSELAESALRSVTQRTGYAFAPFQGTRQGRSCLPPRPSTIKTVYDERYLNFVFRHYQRVTQKPGKRSEIAGAGWLERVPITSRRATENLVLAVIAAGEFHGGDPGLEAQFLAVLGMIGEMRISYLCSLGRGYEHTLDIGAPTSQNVASLILECARKIEQRGSYRFTSLPK